MATAIKKLAQVFLCQNFLDLFVDQIYAPVAFPLLLNLLLFSLQHAINWVFEANTTQFGLPPKFQFT